MDLDQVGKARLIAELVHSKQRDKSGNPYIGHPSRVAQKVTRVPGFAALSAAEQTAVVCASWLHDVLEDSGQNGFPPVLKEDLVNWGFDHQTVSLVELLSRGYWINRHEFFEADKEAYYLKIAANPLAKLVKIADLADNTNHARMDQVDLTKRTQLRKKYEHASLELKLSQQEKEWLANDNKAIHEEATWQSE